MKGTSEGLLSQLPGWSHSSCTRLLRPLSRSSQYLQIGRSMTTLGDLFLNLISHKMKRFILHVVKVTHVAICVLLPDLSLPTFGKGLPLFKGKTVVWISGGSKQECVSGLHSFFFFFFIRTDNQPLNLIKHSFLISENW